MAKAELHELVDRLPGGAVDGAAVLLGEISAGRIDRSETYKEPCAGIAPGCVHGVVIQQREWAYPQGLPSPQASGTTIVGHFTVRFPST